MNHYNSETNGGRFAGETGLTFDDVLLLPNYSDIRREEIEIATKLTDRITLAIPLLAAPMDTVTESNLAIAMGNLGGLGVIHRNMEIERQKKEVEITKGGTEYAAAAVGIGSDLSERAEALIEAGADIIVIDSAHGFTKSVISATEFISGKYPQTVLVSGSVATAAGAKALIEAGAKVLRVGMGPGSICTTRIVAGVGVPQLTAILETVAVAKQFGAAVIADGGLRTSGDIVKALAGGAAAVMAGSLFAGTLEAPGKLITIKGKKYKSYRGMGSVAAMKEGSAARYGQNYRKGQEKKLVAEGVEGYVPYKGTLAEVTGQLTGGLRAGMYYTGAVNLKELSEKTRFMKVTPASVTESQPHDIVVK